MGSELVVTSKGKDKGITVDSSMKICIQRAAAIKKKNQTKKQNKKLGDIEHGTDRE